MAGLGTGAPIVKVYHEKSMILPDVSRVLACLYEKDIKFQTHTTSSFKGLLRLQASSHVPVPFDDGLTFLEESREICRYIAETYEHQGYPFLLGKDSLERASIEQWLHHEEHNFNPPSRSLFCHLAFPLAEEDDDIDLQKRKLEEVLEVYEQRLGDSEFLAGNKFTLADLVHLPNSHYITGSDKFAYLYDSRKNVQRWWKDISTRKSWQNVLKDIQLVEQQRKHEEFEKQQQRQWLRERPPTTRRRIRIDSRKQTGTKPQTVLVPPPVGIISTSPTASQAEKPIPTGTSPGETPLSAPTTGKSSTVQSKHTTIFTSQRETPPAPTQSTPRLPGYPHIPVQSTSNSFTPATSPTIAENLSRTSADKPEIRGVSLPSEATEIDLPGNSKRSSSNEVSHNLRVFNFYEANSHIDEAEPYLEPTPQKPSEMLDRISEIDGSSNATDHAKTSARSAQEDSVASGFWTDNTATSADTLDKKSVRYTERTLQRPDETIYSRSTDHRATYTSPGEHGSTEAHQKLQTEQWHGTASGLSNLKGETDYSMPTQQVKPGKEVKHSSSQDSEQGSTNPLAQESVSMDRQLVQGPEMTPRTLYHDQKRDVSSMLWQKTADFRGIAEEDKASSDHRDAVMPSRKHVEEAKIVSADHRKDASLPMRVKDEDTQAIPFQTAYDDAHDSAQEARETASAPRPRRDEDAYHTSELRETYHSSPSRPQPINVPQHAAPPSKQEASEGPQRATAPYPAAQEFIKQVRGSPASRPTGPHDTQGSTKEETGESSSSKAHPLDSHLTPDSRPPKKLLDEDRYGSIAPLQTGYADDPYNRKRDRDAAAPKQMISQDAFEETKMTNSAPFEAQTFDHQRADAPPQKQRPAEDPQTIASPLKKRYSGGEDTTKQSKDAASRPRRMATQEVQDNFKETKAGDSLSTREPPSDTWRAPPPLPRHQVDDDHSTTAPTQKRYPGARGTVKEVEENTSMPRRVAGGDAKETLEETNFAESASSRAQPLYYDGTDTPSRKQDAIEDPHGATSPSERRYADARDTTKHSRDTALPSKIVGQDTEDTSEEAEAEARNSALFRAQPQDARRVPTTTSKQAAEDALSVSRSSPKRYPRAEETSKQPREAASKPTHMAAQDARNVFRESKVADSTPSTEQPSDPRAAASFQKQEIPDARNTSASFQKTYPDDKGATKKSKVTFEETESPDSASSRVQPSDSRRDYAPSWKKEAMEAPRATSPFKKRDSDVEDTAKRSDGAPKPRQMVGQDTQGTYEETKVNDFGLPREQSSDTWQATNTPTEKVATEDGGTPPSERNAPSDGDTTTRPRGTASAPRLTTAGDASGTFQESKPADSVSSREQPLSARQPPAVTPSGQETEDSYSKISAFHKTRPFVEDSSRQGVDTVFGPRKIGAKDAKDSTEETKVADSASSVRARPTYTPRTARPLSEQAEVEDAQDKDREGRETFSAPKKMVSRDAEDTYGQRKTPHSAPTEQFLDNLETSSPLKQAAAEDSRGATRGARESLVDETKHSRGVKGASKKPVGTFEETKDPGSTLSTAQPVSAQDAQRTGRLSRTPTADQWKDAPRQLQSNLQEEVKSSSAHQKGLGSSPSQSEAGDDNQTIMGEKVFSSEQLRKMPKESRSATSKPQPADSRSPTKVKRMPSVYQEDHPVVPDSREQPQTLPTAVRADGSTPKRQQAPVIPSTSEEKSTPPTPPRAKAHDDHTTGEPVKRDTVDDPKGASLLSGQEPTSQVQRATELTPAGDMSSKLSTIDKWRLTSAPIQGVTPNSGDDALGVSTIDQKPTSMSQQSLPSARGANEMVKREQGMVPTAPAGAQTPDVQHAPPSFGGTDMAERNGRPVQMQAPTQHARPTSVPTRRATPDARDTGDNEFANTSDAQRWKALKAKHDSVMIDEDVPDASLSTHDATGDNKTTWHADEAKVSDTLPGSTASPVNVRPTSGDKLVERLAPDQGAKPPESTQAETSFDAPGDSVSTQGVTSDALDKTKIAKLSSTEGMRPTAGSASTLEAQLAEHKFAPADKKSARAAEPQSSVETRKEDTSVSAADQTKKPQTIFRQEARPSTPITKLVPSSNAYHDTRKMQQATLDNLPTDDSPTPYVPSYEQVSHTPQTIPSERDMPRAPGTSGSPISNTQIASAKFQEAIPDNYRPDELTVPSVSSAKGSYAGSSTEPHEGPSHDPHGAADDKDITKYPSKQAPVLEYRPETSADSYVRPTSGDDPGISPGQGAESPTAAQAKKSDDRHNEVFPAEKKFALSDQDSVHSVQQPSAAETRKGETIVAAAEHTLPTNIGQQHTRDMREAPTSDFVPAEDIPSDAQSGRPDKVALAEQKFASSDQDTQLTSSVEPRNEEIRNSTRSAQPLFSAEDDQTKDPQTTIGQQDMVPTPGTSKSPSSGQFQEVAPNDHRTVESLPNQGQISRAKPSFVLSEGPTHDSHSDIDKNTTKLPSSQPQSSDPKPDPTQNRSDEPPTKNLPSQLPKQHEETQALPPLVGPYDSKPSQDVTSDTLGKAKSLKPSSIDQEAMGSAFTPDIHLGRAPGEVAPSEQKLLLKDQDSARPTQKSSSSEPTKEQSTVTAPSEARASPTIFRQQDIALAQTKMKDPYSGSQYVPQRLQEITPEDQRTTGSIPRQKQVPHFEHISKPNDGPTPDPHGDFVEEPMAHTTGPTPHAQYDMAPSGLSPDEEKPDISDKDSDHPTQLRYSAGSRKEEGDVDASGQTIMPAPRTGKSSGEVLEVGPGTHRSSELTKPLIPSRKQDSHEGPNPDAHRAVADKNKQPPLVSQARTLEAGLNSAPFSDDVIPTSGDEPVEGLTNEHEKPTPEAFQAPLKATGEVTPADQSIAPSEPIPVVESRKESTGTEAEKSKVYQPVTGQKDIRHASGISESVLDDDRDKESASREEQVSHDQIASEPREGSPPDVYGGSLDKKTTPPSSQAQSSNPKRDALPKSVDVNPSSREQSTTRSLLGHGLTRSPPLHESLVYPESNEDVPESFKPPSANQEVTSPKVVPASAPDTILGTASDEIDPDGQNFPLPVQDSARSAQRPFSVEPIKQKGIVASSDQTNEAQTIIGQRGVTLSTDKENTPFDLEARELAKPPNEDQEQVHVASAYEQREEPTIDAHGAVDEKVPHPSIQAEKSDIVPDSAPISGDTHRTSVDGPTTGSRDSEAQPPTGTPIVPTLFLEKNESPTPSSADQDLMMPMTSPTPAPEAPQDQDITTSQLSPSVVSRKDVADQANVAHAGLREPASSDSTRPSEKIQESGPDAAYLTKSEKSLLPMKGADPVQPPYEASLDLSSNEKTTIIKGDQANTISNVSLSASQTVDQPEKNSAVKGPLSEEPVSSFSQKNLERTSPEEISKQHQQIDQSSTRSSKDDIIEARGTANPNILTRSGDIQQLPVKESMQEARSRNQQQAGKKIQENEVYDNGSDGPEEIRPDSAPISGDARRTSGDRPATSSLPDSQEQPPAGTLNVPAVFLEKIESRRPPSIGQELMTSKTSTAPAPDAPQDQDSTRSPQLSPSVVSRKGVANADQTNVSEAGLREPATSDVTRPSEKTQAFSPDEYLTKSEKPLPPMKDSDPVQTPHEDSFDLSSDEKPTMIKGEQASTISNVSLSASQPVGQSENSGVKGPLSEDLVPSFSKNYERTLPEEKLNQQQQTDKSSTRSSKDNSIEASGTASPNILTTSGDIQPSLKESMQAAQGSRNQQQAGQAVFQSMQDNIKRTEETEARDNGYDEPKDIRPDLTPISGDARRTSDDAPASDSLAEPPAGTLNVPTVFLENIGSPRPPSIDQKPITPTTSPAPAPPDARQDQDSTQSSQLSPSVVSRKYVANADQTNVPQAGLREPASSDATRPSEEIQKLSPDASLTKSAKPLPMTGTNPVQPPHEASFDLSSNGKPTMIKGDQANTISNVSLSASQAVGQSENSGVKGPLSGDLVSPFSQKTLGTSPKEKPNQQQQTDQSNTISSKNDSIVEARGTTDPDISTSGVIQPSPLKGSMQVAEGSIDQRPADEAVFESTVDDEKQFEETEARVIGPNELYETNLQQSLNQNNKGPSQMDALQQPEERVPAVQPRRNDTNVSSKPTKEAPGGIQEDKKSDSSSRSSEESEQQVQTERRTQGGETKALASKAELPEERDLPLRNKGSTSQPQAESLNKPEEQSSSSTQSIGSDSSKLEGSGGDVKPADSDDNPPSP